jgi:hypothetical protein
MDGGEEGRTFRELDFPEEEAKESCKTDVTIMTVQTAYAPNAPPTCATAGGASCPLQGRREGE